MDARLSWNCWRKRLALHLAEAPPSQSCSSVEFDQLSVGAALNVPKPLLHVGTREARTSVGRSRDRPHLAKNCSGFSGLPDERGNCAYRDAPRSRHSDERRLPRGMRADNLPQSIGAFIDSLQPRRTHFRVRFQGVECPRGDGRIQLHLPDGHARRVRKVATRHHAPPMAI
jgi:hypothetical protein